MIAQSGAFKHFELIDQLGTVFNIVSIIQHQRMSDKGFYDSFNQTRHILLNLAQSRFDELYHRKHNPEFFTPDQVEKSEIDYNNAQKNLLEYTTTFMLSKLYLMQEENCEGGSALREGDKKDDKLPERRGIEVELADAIIRILDFAGCFGLDIGGAIRDKMSFNLKRPNMHGKNA